MTLPVVVRSLIFTIIAPGTVGGWLPYWLAHTTLDSKMIGKVPDSLISNVIGWILLILGASIYLWCAYDFTFIGRGTPAIFDPPKYLVIRGLYNYVRNPMYIGIVSAIIGQTFLFGSPSLLFYAVLIGTVFSLFVKFYEEPHLRKKFGEDYVRYTQRANRWRPKG